MKIPGLSKPWKIAILLTLALVIGISAGYISSHIPAGEDRKFQQFTQELFREEVGSNTLDLHYTLAHPEKYHIPATEVSLGEIHTGEKEAYSLMENYQEGLRGFSYENLSEENQITLDMLLLYFHTLRQGEEYELLEEVLSPGLGIQAQLPVLLAEYTFYDAQDIEDYLKLLESVGTYFESIVVFEQEKAAAGYFMTDACLDRILQQCREFVENPGENYLLGIFRENIEKLSFLEESQKKKYIEENNQKITQWVIPAYEMLITELEKLRGSGKNDMGLAYFTKGREYYCYLLKTQVGTYDTPDEIRQRLYNQLLKDYQELSKLLEENPSLMAGAYHNDYSMESPREALIELQESAKKDFPFLDFEDYEIKYVHESLEDFLSPAFYLTPPIDTLSPNAIYINRADQSTDLELFATLGHEGFPGHLYQTQYFAQNKPADIRYLPGFGGYVEGWATYVESYVYSYAKEDEKLTRLMWLNRSINLCLYSMVDMGVHYYGWTKENVKHYLGNFGITNAAIIDEIYSAILENPVNYLKYYVGYLNFLNLKEEMMVLQGEEFDIRDFHKQILEIGPVQFPVLRKHLEIAGN